MAGENCLYENVKSKSFQVDFLPFIGRAILESYPELWRIWYEVGEVEIQVEGEGKSLPASGYDGAD